MSINKEASIFTAECVAINIAMDIALEHTEEDANIFADYLVRFRPYIMSALKIQQLTLS